MSETVHVLVKARDLIAEPTRWTKRAEALSAHGALVSPRSPLAVCWCLRGAVERAAMGTDAASDDDLSWRYWQRAIGHVGDLTDGRPARFNDLHTHSEVLDVLDAAIAKATGEAQ